MTKTLAIYITPPADDSFYRFATDLLGYDIWPQQNTPHSKFSDSVGGASAFGLHCTIGDALVFQECDEDEMRCRLSWICNRITPFQLSNFRVFDAFWAGPQVLVAGFSEETGRLKKLAALIATMINPLYLESPYYPKLLPLLPSYNEQYYLKYGAPQVLENYTPHFTLASNIPDERTRAELVSFVQDSFFQDAVDYKQSVDRVHLVSLKSDGFYEIIDTYMLGSGNAVEQ